jgi:hypothetical protein
LGSRLNLDDDPQASRGAPRVALELETLAALPVEEAVRAQPDRTFVERAAVEREIRGGDVAREDREGIVGAEREGRGPVRFRTSRYGRQPKSGRFHASGREARDPGPTDRDRSTRNR